VEAVKPSRIHGYGVVFDGKKVRVSARTWTPDGDGRRAPFV